MTETSALRSAIDLLQVPSRLRAVKSEPLPTNTSLLLTIAAGDEAALQAAVAETGRPAEFIREAASFYIEQVLLSAAADHYRVLGCARDASAAELRRNMALLMRWLHPDLRDERSVFAGRVTAAWDALKTADRRAAYDESLADQSRARSITVRRRRLSTSSSAHPEPRGPLLWRWLGRQH